ncbi:electron transfer flavoprotein subunit alpha/FixB family protein [Acidianus brierleyi]|uniref:Electron transfer flavoprotein subunit alpha n=1 Tax=Acidianus brierleyi TaxID=41673 RepID=A0A2U9II80_9CREN|nr:electron transfer flavoprotein subunit alpha/FixB family protein [Acidianus brierleyi]AWR95644.1 electron transfer flavoprotein subunit alpha/FixB family protein [Acidianus brierleyi]
MKVVVFSESPPHYKMASAIAQSLNPDELIGISPQPFKFTTQLYVYEKPDEDGLVDFISNLHPDLLLTGSVRRDRVIASRVAGRLKAGYIPDAVNLKFDNKLTVNRTSYSGIGISQLESSLPAVVTIAGTQLQPKEIESKMEKIQLNQGRIKIVNVKPTTSGANLATAQIVIGVGRGIGSKENVKYAEELANAIGGVVGGSRPVAAELNWVSEDRQIGLSGLRIRPKLYIALGISGQPQHIAGIRDSKIIVAVNKDKNAPIIDNADYMIVGDAVEFCKVMTGKLKK